MTKLWYSSLLVFETIHGRDGTVGLKEASIYLLIATDENDAREKSALLGQAKETEYVNCDNEIIYWRFVKVEDVQEVSDQLIDGIEVYSRMEWAD